MISAIQNNEVRPNFRAARVNLLATSDNHGNLLSWALLSQAIKNNKKDIFVKAGDKSSLNLLTIAGDWFINPSKRGFITKPTATNGDLQFSVLNKFIAYVHKLVHSQALEQAPKGTNSKDVKPAFDTLFTMGNHDLDGGDKFMYKVMKNADMKTLVTNVNMEKSPGIVKLANETDKVVKSQVYTIPDDKDPNLNHKLLLLGVTIPSMMFYNPGLLKEMSFIDDSNKKDANLTEDDLMATFKAVSDEVDKFKTENPKGAVVLMSHTGNNISKMILKHAPEIDVILNGHDHKNLTSMVGKTNIDSLGKDNDFIKALNLTFDDDGNLIKEINTFFTKTTSLADLDQNPIQLELDATLSKDLAPVVSLKDISGEETSLDFNELEVRSKNSRLANWLTSVVKDRVALMTHDPSVIVGIQSSIIRGGLKNGSNNLNIMKVFDGVSEDLSNIRMGTVKGNEIVGLIVENVKSNLKAPKRNTLIQWSDIQVDKTLISQILEGKSNKKFEDAIKIRSSVTNEFAPIDLDQEYKMALGEKFLVKNDIEWPKKIRDRFVSLNCTYDQLLRAHISGGADFQLVITPKAEEQRYL